MRASKSIVTILSILFLTIIATSSAAALDISITPKLDSVQKGETAEYDVFITNNKDMQQVVEIFSPNVVTGNWLVFTNPISDAKITIPAKQSKKVSLRVRAIGQDISFGAYALTLEAKTSTERKTTQFTTYVVDPNRPEVNYFPRVLFEPEPEFISNINPQEQQEIKVHLVNQNSLDIKNLEVKIESEAFEAEKKSTLGPYEEKTITFTIQPEKFTKPSKDTLAIRVLANNNVVRQAEYPIEYKRVSKPFVLEEETQDSFLKRALIINVENPSNVERREEITYPAMWLIRPFTDTIPNAEVRDGEYVWEQNLQANEKKTIIVATSYRTLAGVLLLIGIIIFAYYYFKPDLIINKNIVRIEHGNEGEFKRARITIYVKNNTKTELFDVQLKEKLPAIAAYMPKDIIGSMRPQDIRVHTESGTELRWKLGNVGPGEEHLITYDIEAKLKIVGEFAIPQTTVSYIKENKEKELVGNALKIQ